MKATRGKGHHIKKKAGEAIFITAALQGMDSLVKNVGMEPKEVKVKSYWASAVRLWILKSL